MQSRETRHAAAGVRDDGAMPRTADAATARADLVDALLAASRAMVSLAGRSLAGTEVTLPQYRALVVLASRGPQRVVDISAELGVNPSTGTRMSDRLIRKGLVRRDRRAGDRREVRLSLTAEGRRLVQQVMQHRRSELERIADTMPGQWQEPVTAALRRLTELSGEPAEGEWWLGWATGEGRGSAT